jgi:Rod binding domain-containing protein
MSASLAIAPVPADVRADGAEGRKLYAAALGFEQMLVRTLAQQLTATATSEDDENGDAAADLIREQIPDALADGVAASGGLGLAHDLYTAMKVRGK